MSAVRLAIPRPQFRSRPAPRIATPRILRVGLLGLGTVGQGLVELLSSRNDDLARRHGVSFEIERVLVRDIVRERRFRPDAPVVSDAREFADADYDVVVEAIGGLEPAGELIEGFLRRGIPVVTANKTLLADRIASLEDLAESNGTSIRFEASVAAGLPLIRVIERSLSTTTVARVEAILNATSNVVVSAIDRDGATVDEALATARRKGFAEADARLDTSGYDAAQKLSVLTWSLSGRSLPWNRLEIRGIDDVTSLDTRRARVLGGRIKPVAVAELLGDRARGFVTPAFVPADHPLAGVDDAQNGVRLEGDTIADLFLAGPGAGGIPTAASLLDDLVELATATHDSQAPRHLAPCAVGPERPVESPWFVAVPLVAGESSRAAAIEALSSAGVRFVHGVDVDEDGTTVLLGLSEPCAPDPIRIATSRAARAGLEIRAFRALARR